MLHDDFMQAIYQYEDKIGISKNILQGDLLFPEEKQMVLHNENAFLFGLISDQSVRAEIAWSLPYKLSQRLGHFDVNKIISEYDQEELSKGHLSKAKRILILLMMFIFAEFF